MTMAGKYPDEIADRLQNRLNQIFDLLDRLDRLKMPLAPAERDELLAALLEAVRLLLEVGARLVTAPMYTALSDKQRPPTTGIRAPGVPSTPPST
jgi:hypothetical protein